MPNDGAERASASARTLIADLDRCREPVGRDAFVRAAPLVLMILVSGCGLLPPESYVIHVDSLTVTPVATVQALQVTAHGTASRDGCGGLHRVERRSVDDTLTRRFVGERQRASGGNYCTLRPVPLIFAETVSVSTGRAVRYRVQQPSGPPLLRDLTVP
jgi:hypothetical protein